MNADNINQVSRVLVVEDDAVLSAELCRLIDASQHFCVVGNAGNFQAGEQLLHTPHDVLVVDVGLPDGDGIDLLAHQQSQWPTAKSLVMTVFDDRETTTRAIAAGADGYVTKTDPDFIVHLELLVADQNPIDPSVAGHLVQALRDQAAGKLDVVPKVSTDILLTPREQETLEGLSLGLSYREIAAQMHVSPHTVTDYIKGVYRKLEVNSRSEAVYSGVRRGLVNFS